MAGTLSVQKIQGLASSATPTVVEVSSGHAFHANTLKGTTTAGSITIQGEGSATTNLQQGLCKQWVDFKMLSGTEIADSFNTSNFTDSGTGVGQVFLTNNLSSGNSPCTAGSWGSDTSGGNIIPNAGNAGHSNRYWFYTFWHEGSSYDQAHDHAMTFGDLA